MCMCSYVLRLRITLQSPPPPFCGEPEGENNARRGGTNLPFHLFDLTGNTNKLNAFPTHKSGRELLTTLAIIKIDICIPLYLLCMELPPLTKAATYLLCLVYIQILITTNISSHGTISA